MNVLATAASSAASAPAGLAGGPRTPGEAAMNWTDVLSSKMKAGDDRGPARTGSQIADPRPRTKERPGRDDGGLDHHGAPQAKLGMGPGSPSTGARFEPNGDAESAGTGESTAAPDQRPSKGQPLPRSRRSAPSEDSEGMAELLAAFQFQPLPRPVPEMAMSPVTIGVGPASGSPDESPAAGPQESGMELPLLGTPKPGLGAGDLFGAKLADPKGAKPVELAKSAGVESPPLLPPSGESSHTAIKELFAGLSPSPTAPAATPSPLAAPPMELGAEAAPTEPADSPAQAEAVGGIQAPHAAGEIHGTPGAQGGGTMKSGREQSEIAGWFTRGFLTRQNSTGDGRRVTAAISTSWRTKHSADGEFGDLSALNGSSPIASGAQAGLAADAMEVAAAPVSVAAHITEQAVHFKSSGLNSLQVVLKPDSNTEIHLKFVTRDGQTEAHAHVAMGDLQHLGSNWTQLQDSLAQQGIRLLPLSSDGSFAGGAGAQGDGAARPPLPEVPGTPLVAAKPVSPSSAASTAPEPTVHQLIKRLGLLDSWA